MAIGDPSLRQLRSLRALAETGSFAAASDGASGRAQVWQQIHRLERYVTGEGDAVVRLTKGGQLTGHGRVVLDAANQVLDAVDAFRLMVEDLRRAPNAVHISSYPAHAVLVATAAAELARQSAPLPMVMRAITDDDRRRGGVDLIRRLRNGVADVAICDAVRTSDAPDITSVPLYDWQLVAVAATGHPLHGRQEVELSEVVAGRFMTSPPGHASRSLLERTGLPIRPTFESESVDALFTLATAGWALGLIPGDALPVARAGNRAQAGWPVIRHVGETLGGRYVAAYVTDSPRASAARRVTSTLARLTPEWGKNARFVQPARRVRDSAGGR